MRFINSATSISAFIAVGGSYPFAVVLRDYTEMIPKQFSKDIFENNYRKALSHIWSMDSSSNSFAGLYKRYFYKTFPWMFTVF